jgi:hypothetical protein
VLAVWSLDHNWVTVIIAFLLLSPILFGFIRGLPAELEMMKYSIRSMIGSIQWIISYALSLWVLKSIVLKNTWHLEQLTWIQQQLNNGWMAWMIALPVCAFLISWFLDLFVQPVLLLLFAVFSKLQGYATHLPKAFSRVFGAVLLVPKGVLHALVFAFIIHIAIPYVHAPALSKMKDDSQVYQWTDHHVINPLLASSLAKRFPVLSVQAGNWIHEISKNAAEKSSPDAKGFWTWQTRFDSNSQIDQKAREIASGGTTDRQKAYLLYQWIGSHVKYDDEKATMIENNDFAPLSFGAIPTYQTRKGVCSDYSSLMVAMGRAVGLKVKQEFGEAVLPDGSGGPHAWNSVYLADEQKWVPCDPTWEEEGNFFNNPGFYKVHKLEKQEG